MGVWIWRGAGGKRRKCDRRVDVTWNGRRDPRIRFEAGASQKWIMNHRKTAFCLHAGSFWRPRVIELASTSTQLSVLLTFTSADTEAKAVQGVCWSALVLLALSSKIGSRNCFYQLRYSSIRHSYHRIKSSWTSEDWRPSRLKYSKAQTILYIK